MQFFYFVLVLCFLCGVIVADNGHEPKTSPRKSLYALLAANGCTNRFVARMAIDAATQNVPATTINRRLQGITSYDSTQMVKW